MDGIRALAILAVILYHLGFAGWSGGFIGVNVFFVLSGYLITSLLLKEQMQTGSIHLGRFWFRRVLRLYPTLIGVVIVGASLWFLVRSDGASLRLDAGGAALIALTYTGNIARAFGHLSQGVFAPTWSLAMEEQFYLLWPPALLLLLSKGLRRRTIAWALAVLVVAFSVTSGLLFVPPNPGATPDIYFNPISSAAPLLLGAVLALTLTHERARSFFAGVWGRVAIWLGFVGIVGLMVQITIEDNWQQEAHVFGLTLPAVALATAFLVAGLVSRPSVLGSVLSWKPLSWFGRNVSYSLYLWHMLVIALLEPFVSGFLGQLVLVAASIAVAIGSHYAIERPFLKVKARFEPASWSAPAKRERELAKA
ncbi:acyltransferase family protein [Frondihabitans cladoniiphilus]|uniref:acyltransferase family protein n=1 Tax=Frondihabitans cladoniiphilus TaxID=715785 RepID=UPI0031E70105